MKKLIVIFFLLATFLTKAQSDYADYFQTAYTQHPKVPKGLLEAISYSNTRINNINPSVDFEPHHGPARYGLFGLILDGKGFFKNNLLDVCAQNNLTPEQFLANPRIQILAVASFIDNLSTNYPQATSSNLSAWHQILKDFSEIQSSTLINQFARELYSYEIYTNLNKGFSSGNISVSPQSIHFSEIYNESTLKILKARNVTIERSRVTADGSVFTPVTSPDYPPALYVPASTSNYSSRSGTAITAVTVHTVQGTYAGCISWFQNSSAGVSAHYVVRSSDGQITQMVLEADKAWHVKSANPYTIGIEHEGYVDNASWYTDAMYQASANLTIDICRDRTINPKSCYNGASSSGIQTLPDSIHIKGHQHFPVQTHTDPGINWNWPKYYALINPSSCGTPANLVYTSPTLSSVKLGWDLVNDATNYTIQIRVKGTTTWSNYTSTVNSYTASGLQTGTYYEWQVSATCASGTSNYSSLAKFKTLNSATNTTDCNGTYTDTGGSSANYTNNEHATYTIAPLYATSLSVTFNSFGLEANFDYMYIYNGTSTSAPLLGVYTGTNTPGTFTANSGAVTFRFFSDGATVSWGWTATWQCTLPTCGIPSGLNSGNITSSSATLNWSAVTNATSYVVQTRVLGSSTWTENSVTTLSKDVASLIAGTSYEWQVSAVCPYGNSLFSAVQSFSTLTLSYCPSNGQSVTDEYIAKVQLNTINNASGATTGGYANYTTISTDVYQTGSYPVTLTPGFTGSAYPEYFRVWIDFNNDKDFSDAGEMAYDAGATNTSAVSGNITIPSSSILGQVRMRVSMKYNGASTACESFPYGEVEDYTLNIVAPLSCNAPAGINASSVTSNSAIIGWSSVTGSSYYNLRYRVTGSSTWTNVTSTTNSKSLSGLSALTTYELQILTNCSGINSAYSAVFNFNTLGAVTSYCVSKGQSQADEWIANVKIGSINNATTASAGGYGDYSYLITDLVAGSANTIYLKPGFTSSAYPEYFRVWIDLNNDYDFDDAGELVYDEGSANTTSPSGTITIPSATSLGTKRMRVSMKYNGAPTSCETFGYGEVEDYSVKIIAGGTSAPKVVTIGAGTSTNNTLLYDTYHMDHRVQMILTKAELQAAGWVAGQNYIGYVAFNTGSASTQVMNAFTIKIKNIVETSFGSSSFITGATQVYSSNFTATANSWNTHTLSTPFNYNGNASLLIEVCFNNSTYTTSSTIYGSTQSTYKTLALRTDIKDGGACSNTTGTRNYFRPNVKLKFMNTASGRIVTENSEMNEHISGIDFSVFPNPNKGEFYLNVNSQIECNSSVLISDQLGRKIYFNREMKLSEGNNVMSINMNSEEMPTGIYYIVIQSDIILEKRKLIVIR